MKWPLVALVALLAGCAGLAGKNPAEDVLFNPVIESGTLEVSVFSHGCTLPEHFYLTVSQEWVELRRTKADVCRAAPQLVRLSFSYPFESRVYRFKNDVRFSNRVERR